jgi:hypothetical protein
MVCNSLSHESLIETLTNFSQMACMGYWRIFVLLCAA